MNHAITIGGLLLTIGILVGVLAVLAGIVMIFAAGMSDAQSSDNTGRNGCIALIGGIILLVGCIAGLVL